MPGRRAYVRSILSKVLGIDIDATDAAIKQLSNAQIVMRSAISSDVFTFRHALIQDAAYQSLLNSRRRSYHDIIAELLVADRPDIAAGQRLFGALRAIGQENSRRYVDHPVSVRGHRSWLPLP